MVLRFPEIIAFIGVILILCLISYRIGWNRARNASQFASDLVSVTVIERCIDLKGDIWFLLETKDKQRVWRTSYRGKPGTSYRTHPDNLNDYYGPNSPKIDLSNAKD